MTQQLLTIGQVAARTGLATSALRYYDEVGLLTPTTRSSGQRRYGPEAVVTVAVIMLLREIGFTLSEIKGFFTSRARSPKAWKELATRKLDELDTQIAKATTGRHAIAHSLNCPHDDIFACPRFWKTVGGVLDGQTVAEAHRH